MLDDMIYGSGDVKSIFANMTEALKSKNTLNKPKLRSSSLESGGQIPDEIITNHAKDPRFKDLTVT